MSQTAEVIQFNNNEIAAFSEFRNQLAQLKHDNQKAVFNYEDPKGNKEARSHIYKLRQTKSAVEKVRKEQKAEALEFGRKVDTQAKEIVQEIDGMIEIHETPLRQIEEREAARIQAHKDRIESLNQYKVVGSGAESGAYRELLAAVEAFSIDDSLEEFKAEAAIVKDAASNYLRKFIAEREQYESEQAELERMRQEAAAREIKDREERIAREAREKAEKAAAEKAAQEAREREQIERDRLLELERAKREKLEAEQRAEAAAKAAEKAAIEAKERAERERVEDEHRATKAAAEAKEQAKRDAEEAVRREAAKRQAAIDAERAAAQKREADKKHLAKINNEIVDAFTSAGLSEEIAKTVVTLIAKRQIPHTSIQY